MWTKNLAAIFLIAALSSTGWAEAKKAAKENGCHEVSEYKFEKPTRLYRAARHWAGSIMVPQGMALKQIWKVCQYRDGIQYFQDDTDIFEYLEGVREDASGEKRLIHFEFRWAADQKSKLTDEQLLREAKIGVTGSGFPVLKSGELSFPHAKGFWAIRQLGRDANAQQQMTGLSLHDAWWKGITVRARTYWATFSYKERDAETRNAIDPAKWKFESVADEIVKSFKFEKLSKKESTKKK